MRRPTWPRASERVGELVRRIRPDLLVLGGGDTALAVLSALGVRIVWPRGEIEPGMPWFDISTAGGLRFACSVKSGGFGDRWTLMAPLAEGGGVRRAGSGNGGGMSEAHDLTGEGRARARRQAEAGQAGRPRGRATARAHPRRQLRAGFSPARRARTRGMFGVSRPIVRDASRSCASAGSSTPARAPAPSSAPRRAPRVGGARLHAREDDRGHPALLRVPLTIEPAAAFFAAQRRDATRSRRSRRRWRTCARRRATSCTAPTRTSSFTAPSPRSLEQPLFHGVDGRTEAAHRGRHAPHGLSLMGPRKMLEGVYEEHEAIYKAVAEGEPNGRAS